MAAINLAVEISAAAFVLVTMIGSIFRTEKKRGMYAINYMFMSVLIILFADIYLQVMNFLGMHVKYQQPVVIFEYLMVYSLSVEYYLLVLYMLEQRKKRFTERRHKKYRRMILFFSLGVLFTQMVLHVIGKMYAEVPRWKDYHFVIRGMLHISFCIPVILSCYVIIRFFKDFDLRTGVTLFALQILPIPFYYLDLQFETVCFHMILSLEVLIIFVYIVIIQSFRMQEMQKQIEQNRANLVAVQIQPHFILNSLTTVRALCRKRPEDAIKAIDFLSVYMRGIMRTASKQELLSVKRELEFIEAYIEIEKLRFGEKLNVVYEIDELDFEIPGLCVQPLVENAIRHGVMPKEEGGTVCISIKEEADCYCISVTDDGVGFDPQTYMQDGRRHIGIENVRVRLHYYKEAELCLKSEIGKGTKACIKVPKEDKQ